MSKFTKVTSAEVFMHNETGSLYVRNTNGTQLVFVNLKHIKQTNAFGYEVPFLDANPAMANLVSNIRLDAMDEGK